MRSQNDVHPILLHQGNQRILGAAGILAVLIVLAAPVYQRHHNVRLFRLHIAQDGFDLILVQGLIGAVVIFVQQIHQILISRGKAPAAQALGKGHKGNFDSLGFRNGVALGLVELRLRGKGPHRLHARRADALQGRRQAVQAVVDGAGVGHLNQIHAAPAQTLQQLIGRRGGGAAVGLAVDISLKIQHRQICVRQHRGNVLEHAAVIIAAHRHTGRDHAVGDVQVSRRPEVDGGDGISLKGRGCLGGLLRCFGLNCGLLTGFLGTLELPGQPPDAHAADDQHQCRQHRRAAHPPHLGLLAFPLGFPFFTALIHFFVVKGHARSSRFQTDSSLYRIFPGKTRGKNVNIV